MLTQAKPHTHETDVTETMEATGLDWYQATQYEECGEDEFDDSPYCASFLDVADDQGNVPQWAFKQIMREHGSDIADYKDSTPESAWYKGAVILDWLGY